MLNNNEKDYIIRTLLDFDLEKLSKAKPGAILYAYMYGDDSFEKSPSIKEMKDTYEDYKEDFDFIIELLKDRSSAVGKAIDSYKKLIKKYNNLPKLFKDIFTYSELYKAIKDDDDICESVNPKNDQWLSEFDEFFYSNNWNYIPRRLGLDGPDDQNILTCYKKFDGKILTISGKSSFCVYECDNKKFKTLMKELEGFDSDGLTLSEVRQAEDTPGISMNAINNTETTRWITLKYAYSTTL